MKKRPFYRIVIADSKFPRDGRFIETVGTYNPLQNPAAVTLKEDRVRYWLNHGAQPTDTVRSLLKKKGVSPKAEKSGPRVEKTAPPAEPAEPTVA